MPAIESLQTALGALRRAPVLFLAGFVAAVILVPQQTVSLLRIPIVPFVLQVVTFFVTPFVVAGMLGMADEARTGDTALSTLTAVGRDRYVSLLLGTFVEVAIGVVFGILFLIAALVVVIAVLGAGALAGGFDPAGVSTGGVVLGVGVLGLIFLAYLVVTFLIQFFPVAIAVEEASPIEGFTRSYRVVRDNLLPTLGYSLINLVLAAFAVVPITGFTLYRTFSNLDQISEAGTSPAAQRMATAFSPVEVAALVLVSLFVSTLLTTIQRTYAVAFFRRHAREAPPDEYGAVGPDDLDESFA